MKGVYTLIINVKKDFKTKIGSLGIIEFKKGVYLYTGSGIGVSSSIEDRIKRHVTRKKKKFWHIDYLLSDDNEAKSIAAVASKSNKAYECLINNLILKHFNGEVLKGFGSSDCFCEAHLIKINNS
ncbi:MAG: GIY-YIG nuclease family protein, partial [Candidatus Bathyarchaeia archaeon]